MWLLPILRPFAGLAMRLFYRFEIGGQKIPPEGPVLLVANHPNMGADAGGVIVAADRPVRFLAKAPLFDARVSGTLLRGIGAIPLFRRQDDPSATERNETAFDAVRQALNEGWAVAIFPEGISHGEPSLTPLRTGAARIALSTRVRGGPEVSIIPVGMTYRLKSRFRSRALAMVAPAVEWEDLATRSEDDAEAVRELMQRIEEALRGVTVNLERWEDGPAVLVAEAILAAGGRVSGNAEQKVTRIRKIAADFMRLRSEDPAALADLERDLLDFDAILRELKLSPHTLEIATHTGVALRWLFGRFLPFALVLPLLVIGVPLFHIPYRVTGELAARVGGPEVRATLKILGGTVVFAIYIGMLAAAAGWWLGWEGAFIALVLLPLMAASTSAGVSWWSKTRLEARRFLMLRKNTTVREALLLRREALEARIREISSQPAASGSAPAPE
ncbi:MAG: 1-acyl-sn-glycerol-3-phosphate acyltransferase [Acidobacteria bacterium]|nr:1-acyl-sn-glycerol-3-phosphate acyltransferase [Acidobacteriota bacterium]